MPWLWNNYSVLAFTINSAKLGSFLKIFFFVSFAKVLHSFFIIVMQVFATNACLNWDCIKIKIKFLQWYIATIIKTDKKHQWILNLKYKVLNYIKETPKWIWNLLICLCSYENRCPESILELFTSKFCIFLVLACL